MSRRSTSLSHRFLIFAAALSFFEAQAEDSEFSIPRCETIPLADDQVSMRIDGIEKLRWNFGEQYKRPFFFPFNGPSGESLTRMGHPGAPDHDHHQSVWFAHHIVDGLSFWSNSSKTTIKQKQWYRYRDGNDETVMAALLGWYNEEGIEIAEQEVVAALRPIQNGEHTLEIQLTMRPSEGRERVNFEKTNFGLFAVRVAKSISHSFGGGKLTNSDGVVGEKDIFGKASQWMDYSGPVIVGSGKNRKTVTEGITYFDHQHNPRYPSKWHVRSDGWIGASFCMDEGFVATKEKPLTLRYLLHAHSGAYDAAKAKKVAADFAKRSDFAIEKSKKSPHHYEVSRKDAKPVAEYAAPTLIESKRIWDKAAHNAFTDLLFYKDKWYCVFREGSAHVSPDGSIRVITSVDGEKWEPLALITHETEDLRDAKITVTPDGNLMINGAGMQAEKEIRYHSFAWFSEDDGKTWSEEQAIGDPGFWLWRAQWHQGKSYTMGYRTDRERDERITRFYRSDDGKSYETLIPEVNLPNGVGEDTILFLEDDSALCLFRHETGDKMGFLGKANPPYDEWEWRGLNKQIGGPNMIELPDGRIIAAVRLYDGKTRTSLCWIDVENSTLTECLTLPSGGDTSYAGIVWKDEQLWVSYYSSHEDKTCIYLAKVKL